MTVEALLQKFEELSGRVSTLEKENAQIKQENDQLKQDNRLLRQKLDQFIRHYFGGRRNEGFDQHQMDLLLQGLPAVVEMPAPEPKAAAAPRQGQSHPARRVLAEDRLETQEIVIQPEEVKAKSAPANWNGSRPKSSSAFSSARATSKLRPLLSPPCRRSR